MISHKSAYARILYPLLVGTAAAVFLLASLGRVHARQVAGGTLKVGADEIGGVVSSSKGPEAGVWVIAETTDLPTRYIKEVVTDDSGRYLIPALPKANPAAWGRGYKRLATHPKFRPPRARW